MSFDYKIKLPQFEGPFDLLLYFIQRDELDIYDIPISDITEEFLAYIKEMEQLNIELASEFILVAASLMRIKAKMLIPRKVLDDEGVEIDPRQELVDRLLEYKRFKLVCEELTLMETDRFALQKRGNINTDLRSIAEHFSAESELHNLSLYKLLTAFQKVLDKKGKRDLVVVHKVEAPSFTIKEEKNSVISLLVSKGNSSFKAIFDRVESRIHAIFRFLSLLELIQEQIIGILAGDKVNSFHIKLLHT